MNKKFKVMISYPPLKGDGTALLSQNRQFQWFKAPTYIYPVVPAYAATMLKQAGFDIIWNDCIAEGWSYERFLKFVQQEKPDLITFETKTPIVKQHWKIINDIRGQFPVGTAPLTVLFGDHVTALPEESFRNSKVDYVLTGGDYDFLMLNLCKWLEIASSGLTSEMSTPPRNDEASPPSLRAPNGVRGEAISVFKPKLEPGIWYRENGKIKNTGKFQLNHNLDSIPFIDRDLTKWKLYAYKNGNYKRTPGAYIMSGRDCLNADTEIPLNVNNELRFVKIGEFTNDLMKKFNTKFQGISEVVNIENKINIQTFGFDRKTFEIKMFDVTEFIKKPAPETMYEVITESGRKIEVTPSHPFFILENGKIIERLAYSLRIGDYTLVPLFLPFQKAKNHVNVIRFFIEFPMALRDNYRIIGKEIAEKLYAKPMSFWIKYFDLKSFKCNRWDSVVGNWRRTARLPFDSFLKLYTLYPEIDISKLEITKYKTKKNISVNCSLNKDFGRFLGYLLSDGHFTSSKIYCSFGLDEEDLVDDFCQLVKSLFKTRYFISIRRDKKGNKSWIEVGISNSVLVSVLRNVLGFNQSKKDPVFPKILFDMDEESALNFLSSYLAGDGFCGKYGALIRSVSPNLINGISYLLMKTSIPFQIRKCKKQKSHYKDPYELTITYNFIKKLEKVGYIGKKRKAQLSQFKLNSSGPFYSRLFPLAQLGLLKKEKFFPYSLRQKIYRRERVNKKTVQKILKVYPNLEIEALIKSKLRFDKIVEINIVSSRHKFVYDLHLPRVENFIAGFGGIITHNCWYHQCTFCSWPTLYPRFRIRKVENVLNEIGALIKKYKVREVMDDTGTFPAGNWLKEFCNGMIDRGYSKNIYFDCNMRFGALSKEDFKLMKKANFRLLLFGLESANQKTLDRLKKNLKVEKITEDCKEAKKAGLYPHITIMFGYPWETYEDAKKTVKLGSYLLKKGYAYTVQATIVIPYPGSPLFDECKQNDWLNTEDWARFDMKEPVMKVPMGDKALLNLVQEIYKVGLNLKFLFNRISSVKDLDDLRYFGRAGRKVIGHIFDFNARRQK